MSILEKRSSGILMHISSLPCENGIGTFGKSAFEYVDLLKENNQSYWQLLPLCPTNYGDSPYQSFSTFAGNPYFIDFELLTKTGFLKKDDYSNLFWGTEETKVDYEALYNNRKIVFKILYDNFKKNIPSNFYTFIEENEFWLTDYALFMSIKDSFDGKPISQWSNDLRIRDKTAVQYFKDKHFDDIQYYQMLQYFFFEQWKSLKSYANKNGIKIIGDIPIYVALDSADVWSYPQLFQLDESLSPKVVAGCPPDGFSATGQLWGNPVYDWNYLKQTDYEWWLLRLKKSLETYDVIRIDHFRGFDSFYCIPFGSATAMNGEWQKGPGMDLFKTVKEKFGNIPIIAEDLGFLTESVKQLLKDSTFPGMKVLQFAFDSRDENDYYPEKYTSNTVVYTGTHDNDTILGWSNTAPNEDISIALEYFSINKKEDLRLKMMNAAMECVSNTCILTMQDLIGLDSKARMNTPSTLGINWQWRLTNQQMKNADWSWLKEKTEKSSRI